METAMVDEQGNTILTTTQASDIEDSSLQNQNQDQESNQGTVSIVHVTIPNQPVQVQSVIQSNQQSVIQTTPTLQTVQFREPQFIPVHQVTVQDSSEETSFNTDDVDSRKRRELLARRPSYRKILNELSSDPSMSDVKEETSGSAASAEETNEATNTITAVSGNVTYQTATVVPTQTIQIASQNDGLQGLQTLTMTNAGGATTGAIVQYTPGQDGQFFVPGVEIHEDGLDNSNRQFIVTVSAADLQAYQIRATSANLPQGVVMAPAGNIQTPQQLAEEAARKRELRLMKNRLSLP